MYTNNCVQIPCMKIYGCEKLVIYRIVKKSFLAVSENLSQWFCKQQKLEYESESFHNYWNVTPFIWKSIVPAVISEDGEQINGPLETQTRLQVMGGGNRPYEFRKKSWEIPNYNSSLVFVFILKVGILPSKINIFQRFKHR